MRTLFLLLLSGGSLSGSSGSTTGGGGNSGTSGADVGQKVLDVLALKSLEMGV